MGLGIVGVGGTPRLAADERLRDCDAGPGTLILLRGGLPGLELVRYTMPVPVLGIGFEKPGVVGVVGVVVVAGFAGTPGRAGPEAARIRCWSCRFRLYVRIWPGLCGSSPG
jgi:hypothetical protein